MPDEKDIHYFITRIINPDLNWIIASLRSTRKALYGRDGYTGIKWTDFSIGDTLASRLEQWRDDLWYEYKREFPRNGKVILDEFFKIMVDVEARLPDHPDNRRIIEALWELAEKMGQYLSLSEYIKEKKSEVKAEVAKVRAEDERLRRKLLESGRRRRENKSSQIEPPLQASAPSRSTHSWKTLSSPPDEKKFPWKAVSALAIVIILLAVVAVFKGNLLPSNAPVLKANSSSLDSLVKSNPLSCSGASSSLEKALKCYLNDPKIMEGLQPLATQLKKDTLEESAWNVLEWEDKRISYDYSKTLAPSTAIQTPLETIERGKGVCVDYALLTAALLVKMGYSPVYVFDIDFSNDPIGHVVTAIKVNDKYFMLDQHPPVMDLGTYWKDWAYWRNQNSNGLEKNLIISKAAVYEIKKTSQGITVNSVGTLTAEDFKQDDYVFTQADIQHIVSDLKQVLLENYPNLHLNTQIANLDSSRYLPPGYSDGSTWHMEFPHFGEYYNPTFHKEFVDYLYGHIIDSPELKEDLESYQYVWIKGSIVEGNSVKIVINLARR